MKLFILSALVAAAFARPGHLFYPELSFDRSLIESHPLRYNLPFDIALDHPVVNQYHEGDTFGQFRFGYETPESRHHEVGALDGSKHGTYSYHDSKGELQTVNYRADDTGFHAAGTNLPVVPKTNLFPVTETPEVAIARAEHLLAHDRATTGEILETPVEFLPEPVTDEPVVAIAKANHLALVEAHNAGLVEEAVHLEPVTDEPIVAKAKAEHLALLNHEKLSTLEAPVEIISRGLTPYSYALPHATEYLREELPYSAFKVDSYFRSGLPIISEPRIHAIEPFVGRIGAVFNPFRSQHLFAPEFYHGSYLYK